MPDEKWVRGSPIRKRTDELINKVLFEYYGVKRGNKSEEVDLLLNMGLKYSHLTNAYNRVIENENKLIHKEGISPHSIRGLGSGDRHKCHLETDVLKTLDNSELYFKDRTTKDELKKVIRIVLEKPISERQWNKYGKLFRETGRISWKKGTGRYYIHREKMGYATKRTKKNYEKLNGGIQLRFKTQFIEEKALEIYDKHNIGDIVSVKEISKTHKIHGEARETILNAMKTNHMISNVTREKIIILDYKQEAKLAKLEEFN